MWSASATGARTSRATSRRSRAASSPGAATRATSLRERWAADRSRARASPAEIDDLLADPDARRRRARNARSRPTGRSRSACSRAGKHCFVEKPLAYTVDDAERAVAAAAAADRILMVGHLLVYHPGVATLKAIAGVGRARRHPLHLLATPEPRSGRRRLHVRAATRGGRPASRRPGAATAAGGLVAPRRRHADRRPDHRRARAVAARGADRGPERRAWTTMSAGSSASSWPCWCGCGRARSSRPSSTPS